MDFRSEVCEAKTQAVSAHGLEEETGVFEEQSRVQGIRHGSGRWVWI